MLNTQNKQKEFEQLTVKDRNREIVFKGYEIACGSLDELPGQSVRAYYTADNKFIMQATDNSGSSAFEFDEVNQIPEMFNRPNLFMDSLYLKMLLSEMPEWHKLQLRNVLREKIS